MSMGDGYYLNKEMSDSKIVPLSAIPAYWANIKSRDPAIVHDGKIITWASLEKKTNQLARAYETCGVNENDFVVIGLPNGFDFLLACFAAWKLGATPLPISSRLPKIERDQIIEIAQPKLVHGFDDDLSKNKWKHLSVHYKVDSKLSETPLPLKIAKSWKAMTSGGSTGRPKIIVSKDKAEHDIFSRDFLNFSGSVLIPGPLYHNGPFLWAMHALFQGNKVTLTSRFNAVETLTLIDEHNVDTVYLVPTMMHRIWNLESEIKSSFSLRTLQTIWHLASPCPPWLKHNFIDWLGEDVIWELYGGTEGIGFTTISGKEWLAHEGSVGKAGDDFGIKILDENENEVEPMEVGEVFLKRHDGVGTTYYYIGADPRRTNDGWESYGDMGYLDAEGYLYLTDRKTDMILSGGANIYPAEVEAAIDTFPAVRSSIVIGLPDDDLGNAIHAIIDINGRDVKKEEVLDHLEKRLVRYKIPRTLEFVNDPLRDEAGKVRRKTLRDDRINQLKNK